MLSLNFGFDLKLGLPHSSIVGIPWCVRKHPIYPIGIHLLHCAHGNERTRTHDAICHTFVAITQDANFHVGQKQLHAFPSNTFNSSCWQINIVLTKYGICTLINVGIVDPKTSGFISPILHHPRICCFQYNSSQITKLLQPTPCQLIPPHRSGGIWMCT